MCRMSEPNKYPAAANVFNDWRAHMGWSVAEAGRQLGIHYNTALKYSLGRFDLPAVVWLAMEGLRLGARLPSSTLEMLQSSRCSPSPCKDF